MLNREDQKRIAEEVQRKADLKANTELDRGREGAFIIGHPLFTEAVTATKAQLLAEWGATGVNEADRREKIWGMYMAVDKIVNHLKTVIQTGKLAATVSKEPMKFWKVGV